jgi:hypothetical protein
MTSAGSFTARVQGRLAEIRAERAELAEMEQSWADGLAGHLASLVFPLAAEDLRLLGPSCSVVATPDAARYLCPGPWTLRGRAAGGWAFERVVVGENGRIHIARCSVGAEDPGSWEEVRWPTPEGAEPFAPAEVFESLRKVVSGIVAHMDALRSEVDGRRANLDALPSLVRELRATCGELDPPPPPS